MPPYSPELNRIEKFWHTVKHQMIQSTSIRPVRPTERVTARVIVDSSPVFRRRRAMVGLALALALAGGFSVFAAQGQAQASIESTSASFTYVTVHAGDTLWSVAEQYASTADTREWIAELVTLNALQDNQLQPGQRIALPTH